MFVDMSKVGRVLIVIALAGCSTQVTPSGLPQTSAPVFSSGPTASTTRFELASAVTLTLSDVARSRLADNLKFDQDKLLDMVRRALDANNLLAASPDPNLPSIDITVTDVRVRSSFSAVMFGFMAGADRIVGDVVARSPGGEELQRFNVNVSYALGGLAGGQDSTRLDWLYENFAKETAKALTGSDTVAAEAPNRLMEPQTVSAPTVNNGGSQTTGSRAVGTIKNSEILTEWRRMPDALSGPLAKGHDLVLYRDASIKNIEIIGANRNEADEELATLIVKYSVEPTTGANPLRLVNLNGDLGTYQRMVVVNIIDDTVVSVGSPNRLN